MGTFHAIVNILASNGKRFQDVGMSNICMVPGTNADGTISGVSHGRMYNRADQSRMREWREYFQKLMDEDNLRERKKWTATRSGGRHYRDHKCSDQKTFSERLSVGKLP